MNEPNEIIAEQVAEQVQANQATITQTAADAAVGVAAVGGEIGLELAGEEILDGAVEVAGDLLGGIFDLF